MRVPTSGKPVPATTYTLTIANQTVAANGAFTSAAIPLNNAPLANSILIASPRAALPATAGGAVGSLSARLTADNSAVVTLSNASDTHALVATGADIVIDVMALEISP